MVSIGSKPWVTEIFATAASVVFPLPTARRPRVLCESIRIGSWLRPNEGDAYIEPVDLLINLGRIDEAVRLPEQLRDADEQQFDHSLR